MKKLLVGVLLAVFMVLPVSVFAVNTIDAEPGGVQISGIDTAWTWTDNYTLGADKGGMRVNYILFSPGATDDICLIRDTGATGIILFRVKCANAYDQRVLYFNGDRVRPYLDLTEGAPNAGAILTIKFMEVE